MKPGGAGAPADARAAALDILEGVLGTGRAADESIDRHLGAGRLDGRDRAFTLNLVTTTLRRLGQIDGVIRRLVARPIPERGDRARNLIRLGVCQLAFLRTPAHAAVNTAVELAHARKPLRPYAGLVNAVLRRAAAEADGIIAGQDAARINTPEWLWRAWSAAYGETTARAIATAHLSEPPLDLTPRRTGETTAGLDAVILPTGSLRLRAKGPIPALPGFAAGSWWVQDAAAALPATLFGPLAGRRVIDLCAAPGGKTAQLCAAGADVVAVERSARARSPASGQSRPSWPSSGTRRRRCRRLATGGTGGRGASRCALFGHRHHPPASRRGLAEDARPTSSRWPASSQRLLAAAVEMTRPGGTLIYCACSLQPEEGPALIEALLAGGAPVERRPIGAGEIRRLGGSDHAGRRCSHPALSLARAGRPRRLLHRPPAPDLAYPAG